MLLLFFFLLFDIHKYKVLYKFNALEFIFILLLKKIQLAHIQSE